VIYVRGMSGVVFVSESDSEEHGAA
jgi:hypothetical protein